MKWIVFLIIALALAILILFFYKGYESRGGNSPGLQQGVLQACPDKPNCVSSEEGTDTEHSIKPLLLTDNTNSLDQVRAAIGTMGGVVVKMDESYLAATFTSSVFGFVDDLEVRFDRTKGVFHVRSASRVGHSDMGVNRKRVETLRELLQ
ncbi:hypothetical protein BGP75_25345 [Motiliproteus sp. MSK22-1]|nr:hypothetical protein BGP75_25345 [Motiliproteus sp. MSK22-1]